MDRSLIRPEPTRRAVLVGAAAGAAVLFAGRFAHAADSSVKLASSLPAGTPWATHFQRLAADVTRRSKGAVTLELALGGVEGDELSALRACRAGKLAFWAGTVDAAARLVPALGALALPDLFRDTKTADKAIDGARDDLNALLGAADLELAFVSDLGEHCLAGNFGYVSGAADLQGRSLAVLPGELAVETAKALGATPVALPMEEIGGALSNALTDGVDAPPLLASAFGWTDAVTHITLSAHRAAPLLVVASKKALAELPEGTRAVLRFDADAEARAGRKAARAAAAALTRGFKKAGLFARAPAKAERAALCDGAQGVQERFLTLAGDAGRTLLTRLRGAS
ncbi:MAG: TRAP transporter substrate-binding protein DctP [Myxococcales bacterium]|nr:TRAP transporter substrate-binding protein DctP [Myxococcales bacterium]